MLIYLILLTVAKADLIKPLPAKLLIAQKSLTPILDSVDSSASVQVKPPVSDYAAQSSDNSKLPSDQNLHNSIKPNIYVDKQKVNMLLHQGINYTNQGKYKLAQNCFNKIIILDPQNVDALYNLGVIAEEQNNLPDALKNYQLVLKYHPDDTQTAQAIKDIQSKMNLNSNDPNLALDATGKSSNNNAKLDAGNSLDTPVNNTSDSRFAFNDNQASAPAANNSGSQGFQPSKPLPGNKLNTQRNLKMLGYGVGRLARMALRYGLMYAIRY